MAGLRQADPSPEPSRTDSGAMRWRAAVSLLTLLVLILFPGCHGPAAEPESSVPSADESEAVVEAPEEVVAPAAEKAEEPEKPKKGILDLGPGEQVSLFDGKSLGQWKVTDFGGQGDVHVQDGAIYLPMGSYATGITWGGPVIRMNYEITLEAMRVDGTDFFCALTFPVEDNPCTLVLGGWGGTLCGLSNIDFYDASENETTTFYAFKQKTWYHVRLRVVPNRITAWLDGEKLVDIETVGHKIDIRSEMDLCQPLGIATWVTTGAIRDVYLTKLAEPID